MAELLCPDCGLACQPTLEDFGYGETAYGSHISDHRELVVVSQCCGAPVDLTPREFLDHYTPAERLWPDYDYGDVF